MGDFFVQIGGIIDQNPFLANNSPVYMREKKYFCTVFEKQQIYKSKYNAKNVQNTENRIRAG